MPALQVRDFPSELYADLKEYADRHRRSMAQQTIACVEQALRDEGSASPVPPTASSPWASGLGFEAAGEADLRKERRLNVLRQAANIRWKGEGPRPDEVARMIRADRDDRSNEVLAAVEGRSASGGEVRE